MSSPPLPLVSVCIANYNGVDLLPDCIDSILAQQGQIAESAIEIIVHDDASTDDSLTLLRTRFPQAKVIESRENAGFCVANNRMAAVARGEYLLLLNNDAALLPDAISGLLAAAKAASGPALLTLPQYAWDSGELINLGCRLDLFHHPIPILQAPAREAAMLEGACLWIPRATWNQLGGFPEWFGSIAEDAWLCCTARLAGIPVRCLEHSGYRHRQGASFGGNRVLEGRLHTSVRRRRLSERNRIALLVACAPTALAVSWLALHLVALIAEAVVLCVWKKTASPWRDIYRPAIGEAWKLRREILDLRRQTQAKRRATLRQYLEGYEPTARKLALLKRHGLPTIQA